MPDHEAESPDLAVLCGEMRSLIERDVFAFGGVHCDRVVVALLLRRLQSGA
jgi:hypothetical protein